MSLLIICIALTALPSLVSSKSGIISLEVNIPSILNQILAINKSLNTLRASVGYNGQGSLENSLEIFDSNSSVKDRDDIHQRVEDEKSKNASDSNSIKIQINGLEDIQTILKGISRSRRLNPDFSYKLKFPGLFEPGTARRALATRPWVEMAPGTIKSKIINYPPKFLASRLKHLLKLKKKQDQEKS